MVNKKIKPRTQKIVGCITNVVPKKVANQLKTLTPVGTAITIVAAVKYARESKSIPTVYIWCAQTTHPTKPILKIA